MLTTAEILLIAVAAFALGNLCGLVGTAVGFTFGQQYITRPPKESDPKPPTSTHVNIYNGVVPIDELPPDESEAWRNN